jgi:hypothetical protein
METAYKILNWRGVMCAARQPQQLQLGRRDSLVARVLTAEAQSLDVTKVQLLCVCSMSISTFVVHSTGCCVQSRIGCQCISI